MGLPCVPSNVEYSAIKHQPGQAMFFSRSELGGSWSSVPHICNPMHGAWCQVQHIRSGTALHWCKYSAYLLACCSWSAHPWGVSMRRAGPFSGTTSASWLTITCRLRVSLHKVRWGAIPPSGPSLYMWLFMPQKRASKLEFGTLRQTENFPFHHRHLSTNMICLYTVSIYFCWIWPALNARVLDWGAVKINWHFSNCCLAQVSIPTVENYWTQLKSQVLQKDQLWVLHHPSPLLSVSPLQCKPHHYKVLKNVSWSEKSRNILPHIQLHLIL